MPLINNSVANLIQGVSQQPASSRYDGQCEEQENALSSVVEGLKKRPNTRHVATLLTEAISSDSFVHFINRSTVEKYVIIHDGINLRAFNILTGVEATINGSTGGYPVSSTYLEVTNPSSTLEALTIADSTFLLNKNKVAEKSPALTDSLDKEAWVFPKQGANDASYRILLGSTSGIRLDINEIGHDYNQPEEDLTITVTIGNYASGFTPNSYISIEGFYDMGGTTTPSSVGIIGYVYIDAEGDATGLSYTDGGTVINALQFEAEVSNVDDIYSSNYFNVAETGYTAITFTDWVANAPSTGRTDVLLDNFDSAFDGITLAGDSPREDYFTNTNYRNGLLITLKDSNTIGGGLTPLQDFTIRTTDSLSNTGIQSLYKTVDSLSDLPLTCKNGFKIKIIGDADLSQDDYYVEFQTAGGEDVGVGSWVECVGYNQEYKLLGNSLPHRLINTAENVFTFEAVEWDEKVAGNSDSNPFPSFIDNRITNLFLYKNRLGFLSNDSVILSEAGQFFNFFKTTVSTLLDSAPIDVSVSSDKVTNLQAALGFQENLILFAENSQFVLKGGDLLTPRTVSITPVTNFAVDSSVSPLPLGSYLYFPFNRGRFTGIREYTVNATTDNYDSVDITEHVPNYIPSNIVDIAGTTTEELIGVVSGDDPSSVYIYKYFWSGAKKVLSSWSKFTFTGEIRGIEFVEATLYAVVTLNDQTHLVELPTEEGNTDPSGFLTHLDMRVSRTVTAGSDDIDLPYSVTAADNLQVWTKDGAFLESSSHVNSVNLAQPVEEDTEVWVGLPYTMKYTFSEQIFKAASGQAKSPSNIAKLMLKNVNIFYSDTAAFDVKVTPKFRDTFISSFTPTIVGSSTIGTLTLDDGAFRVPVFTKATETVITIESDSALPCSFQSAEFESFIHSRSNRIT